MFVCPRCFKDIGLQRRIEKIRAQSPNEKCSFHSRYKGVPVEDVAKIVDPVFRSLYQFGRQIPVFSGDSDRPDYEQSGSTIEEILLDITRAEDDDVVSALTEALIESDDYWPPDGGEPFYDSTQNYERLELKEFPAPHENLWQNFCNHIVHHRMVLQFFGERFISRDF